jgi:predicted AAA+ superfamily ATPase
LVISGARQAGKTTTLREILSDHHYVSLDLPSLAEQAERDPISFFSTHQSPLIIDEIQYAPGLLRHLKSVVDSNRHEFGQYVLTGSQHFPLMQGVSESLAGRIALLELENLAHQQKLWSSLTFKRRNNGIGKEIIGGRESRRRELAC